MKRQEKISINPDYGYLEVVPKPSKKELARFYRDLYFQKNKSGTYNAAYDPKEIEYINFQLKVKFELIGKNIRVIPGKKFLDVGCGQGWGLAFFEQKGFDVTGLDYSSFGVNQHHPHLTNTVIEGDIDNLLDNLHDNYFDVVMADNILEHAINPVELILRINRILKIGGVLIIEVPNDYSAFQKYLQELNFIDKEHWFSPPQHLIYFNRSSLNNVLQGNGMDVQHMIGSFPIELFLLNEHSNYVKNGKKGKAAHKSRILFDLFLDANSNIEDVIKFYKSSLIAGISRQIIVTAIKK